MNKNTKHTSPILTPPTGGQGGSTSKQGNCRQKGSRLLAVDILRGMTVMFMILVNNGAGKEIFSTLKHSKWDGMTPCDLVFPVVLFIMGFSIFLSLRKTEFRWSAQTGQKILRRTLLLFVIGLAINWFDMACSGSPLDLEHLRVWGVMQRLAICYCAAALLAIALPHRSMNLLTVALLAVYAAILIIGNGYAQDAHANLLSIADNNLIGSNHLYTKSPVDPEGLVSNISAIAHTLIGFSCARYISTNSKLSNHADKALWLLAAGAAIGFAGWLLSFGLPLNKRIWSPSYVLATCGMAMMALGIIVRLVDMTPDGKQNKTASSVITLSVAFGTNPLFLYVASEILGIAFGSFGIKDGAYTAIRTIIGNGYWASLIYSIAFVALHAAMGLWLWRKRIFVKI